MPKKRMGKGLEALLPTGLDETILQEKTDQKDDESVAEIGVDKISAARSQARKDFDDKKLEELAASVREHGVLQPLLVRKTEDRYELVAGERRLRAAKKAGLKKVPVIFLTADHEKAAEMGLIENIQRQDLNAMEEAAAYREMTEVYGHTQESLS